MTRIGFAYNQKPDTSIDAAGQLDTRADTSLVASDEEPPSFGVGGGRANSARTQSVVAPSPAVLPTEDAYAEWDAPETINAVHRALSGLGEVIPLEATADFPQRLRETKPDIVFNMAEGLAGQNRESHVPAICEFYGVPYTGSDPLTLSLCLNKGRTKQMLSAFDIPTAPFTVVETLADARAVNRDGRLRYPLFAKPVHEGSSKGITERNYIRERAALVPCVAELLDLYDQPVLVEEFLPGAEFTCGLLGNGWDARVLPIVGMRFDALPAGAIPIYGFEAKWVWDTPERPLEIFECPAAIDDALRAQIEQIVLRAFNALGCQDWSRIDVRLDAAGVPYIVEVNPLPGILPQVEDNSCLPKAAAAAGISYDELIQSCVLAAAKRQGIRISRRRVKR